MSAAAPSLGPLIMAVRSPEVSSRASSSLASPPRPAAGCSICSSLSASARVVGCMSASCPRACASSRSKKALRPWSSTPLHAYHGTDITFQPRASSSFFLPYISPSGRKVFAVKWCLRKGGGHETKFKTLNVSSHTQEGFFLFIIAPFLCTDPFSFQLLG
jgi:hypothetical protein